MTGLYLTVIAGLFVTLIVVAKGNRNLLADNRRKDATIRNLRRCIREIKHGR